jgi:transcription initiation factor TFIIE subunit alpha
MKVATSLGEEEAVLLIENLKNVDEITDDEIANNTGIRLNSVRKILYKLYDHSLVSLRTTRVPKTGWFIFHWRLQPDQLEGFILSQKRRVLEKLTVRLDYEVNHDFYYAQLRGCRRVTFEEAVEAFSTAASAVNRLEHSDNDRIIVKLKQRKLTSSGGNWVSSKVPSRSKR